MIVRLGHWRSGRSTWGKGRGTPGCPAIIDVRPDGDLEADLSLIPGSVRRPASDVAGWADRFYSQSAVVVCQSGHALSEGVAAWLRQAGVSAETLDGGMAGWVKMGRPVVSQTKLPPRNENGQTVWVTRARPKVDRIACPWLIRRFVDPAAIFLFVASSEVAAVAEQFGATPFDIEGPGVVWGHQGELCTFDVMVDPFGLGAIAPLARLAVIVRGADTDRLDLAPEASGLLAASLGLSRMFADDLEQLEAGMQLYDAFYRWSRDAADEVHNWASHKPAKTTVRS